MARRSTAITVRRAAQRYETDTDGITTRHCFSAGAHYDAANVSFGPLIGVDEHTIAPGAGFDEHEHRGVVIVSWVVSGVLGYHAAGGDGVVEAGSALLQVAGSGLVHAEHNGTADEPLQLLQMTLLDDRATAVAPPPEVSIVTPPVHARVGLLSRVTDRALTEGPTFCYAVSGRFLVDPQEVLGPGDSLRAEDPLAIEGEGELLVWSLPPFRTPVLPRTPARRGLFRRH